jgi:hypothetical protein
MKVEAVVTRPLFSIDHRLPIPEGSRLSGEDLSSHLDVVFPLNTPIEASLAARQ